MLILFGDAVDVKIVKYDYFKNILGDSVWYPHFRNVFSFRQKAQQTLHITCDDVINNLFVDICQNGDNQSFYQIAWPIFSYILYYRHWIQVTEAKLHRFMNEIVIFNSWPWIRLETPRNPNQSLQDKIDQSQTLLVLGFCFVKWTKSFLDMSFKNVCPLEVFLNRTTPKIIAFHRYCTPRGRYFPDNLYWSAFGPVRPDLWPLLPQKEHRF